ncbi:hypothetical protein [Aureimonas frigidaquae]|uniref:hypothetical protein n=1 Tax=Aureimonas frigidaquae TaxID=424757 RepID=UPI0012ED2C3F|nr:hypothetical protein [Aureimonas frigidaquae]
MPMLAACQSYLPQNDEPLRVSPVLDRLEPGPSTQRLDANGYPLIGAYPSAATQQVSNETVAQTRARYADAATRGSAPSSGPTYQRNVAELEATAARVRAAGQANAN